MKHPHFYADFQVSGRIFYLHPDTYRARRLWKAAQHRGGQVPPCALGVESGLVYVLLMGIPLQMRGNRRIVVPPLPTLYL